MTTYIILALAVLAQATGNVFLTRGMKQIASTIQIGGDSNFLVLLSHAVGIPSIWLGTGLLIIFFLLFLTALSRADLSFVLPVISIEVVVNVACADYFLNESVSVLRWVGTILISAGVVIVARSGNQPVSAGRERTPGDQGG